MTCPSSTCSLNWVGLAGCVLNFQHLDANISASEGVVKRDLANWFEGPRNQAVSGAWESEAGIAIGGCDRLLATDAIEVLAGAD